MHLKELNRGDNFYNDTNNSVESTLLEVVSIGAGKFGTHVLHHYDKPTYKRLNDNTTTLTTHISDNNGKELSNKFPIILNYVIAPEYPA